MAHSLEQFLHPEFMLRLFLSLTLAIACSWIVAWHPRSTRLASLSDLEERKTLILLGMVGAVVAELSGTSQTLAFVIFGIGALLRFRTVLDNPKLTVKAIIVVIVGLACGMGSWVMWNVFHANTVAKQSLFQSGWFVVGLLTQTLIVHMIRTQQIPFIQSRAATPVILLTACIMHGLDHDGLGERGMAGLAFQQEARDDAHHPATGLERGVGHQTHQADPTAAINHGYAFLGQKHAQTRGNLPACRIGTETGATEDADGGGDGFHFLHGPGTDASIYRRSDVFPDRGNMLQGSSKARRPSSPSCCSASFRKPFPGWPASSPASASGQP